MKLGSLNTWTRRGVIAAVGLVVVGAGARLRLKAEQAPDAPASNDAIRRLVGDAPLHPGRVRISMPEAVSNDRVVPVAVDVDSPMSESDYVAQIHVLAPDDADPVVASYRLTPDCGRAFVDFRCRLGDGANLVVLAVMSGGEVFKAERTATLAAPVTGG